MKINGPNIGKTLYSYGNSQVRANQSSVHTKKLSKSFDEIILHGNMPATSCDDLFTGELKKQLSAEVKTGKTQQELDSLKEQIKNGTYQIDLDSIAKKILLI